MIILLTSAINIEERMCPNQKVSLNQVRLSETIIALKQWIKKYKLNLILVDNTGIEPSQILQSLKYEQTSKLEILSFYGQNFDPTLGKGFGEKQSISYALTNSKILAQATEISFIVKVNARYFSPSLSSDFCDHHSYDVMTHLHKNMNYCNSRIFGAKKAFFQNFLLKELGNVNDSKGIYFEHCLAKATLQSIISGKRWSQPRPSKIVGISGSNGKPYNDSTGIYLFLRRIRWFLRKYL